MLGVAAFPSLIYTVMCFALPESPRWLIGRKGDRAAGIKVLKLIEPEATPAQDRSGCRCDSRRVFRTRHGRAFLDVAVAGADLAGVPYRLLQPALWHQCDSLFAPRIFEMTGLGAKAALLQSVGIGVTNLIFTFVGLSLIDRLGRRTLLFIGSFGYIISLGLVAWAFFTGALQHRSGMHLCVHRRARHRPGAVIWVFISEIFPNRHRAEGQTLGSSTHWIFAALLTTFFPKMVSAFPPGYVFSFFAFMMVLQLIWVKTMVPETKGVPLEQMQKRLGIE